MDDAKYLIDAGGNINNLTKNNMVPLLHWVKNGNQSMVQKMIDFGADPNFRDHDLRTALHHAVNLGTGRPDATFEMEDLLIACGSKANIKDKFGRTPLYYAFVKIDRPFENYEIDPFETVSSLCAIRDCTVNLVDVDGMSPLHYAAQRGSVISGRYMIK